MSITTIKAQIASIASDITGVQRAYAQAPNSLPPADLPAVVVYTGPSQYTERGYEITGEVRAFKVRLYVLPAQNGIPGEAEAACEPFFARFREAFPPGARLGRLGEVLQARLTGDQGVSVISLVGGSVYVGIEFNLEVTT